MTKLIITGVYFFILLFFFNCSQSPEFNIIEIELIRNGGIVVNDDRDRIANIMEGLQAAEEGEIYGIDFVTKLPFKLSVQSGNVEFLSSAGRGPKELLQPVQLVLKNTQEFYVYDSALDKIAYFKGGEIIDKIPGYTKQGMWLRNTYGYFFNNQLITAIVDPTKINIDRLEYEEARPLAFYNLIDSTISKRGRLSPTLDKLDSYGKFPHIAIDYEAQAIYYVFSMDYTVMTYDIRQDSSWVVGAYKPKKMRTRSIKVDYNLPQTQESAKKYGLDITVLLGVSIIGDNLLVVWQNAKPEFYEQRGGSHKFYDYFGVLYDLKDFKQVAELSLPGKFLGTYKDNLLIEENENLDAYTIGFYKIVKPDTVKVGL